MNISTNLPGLLKAKRKQFSAGTMLFVIVFGLIFTAVGGLLAKDSLLIDKSWKRVDGRIASVNERRSSDGATYTPVISYSVDDHVYLVSSSSSTSSRPELGGVRQVAYNPANPESAKVIGGKGEALLILLFPGTGLLIVIFSAVAFMASKRRSTEIEKLQQTGQKIQGVLADIRTGSDKQPSYRIVVAATDLSGATREFVSDEITGIGALAMADFQTNPIAIDVFIDPLDPKRYYVDITDIPDVTPERIQQLVQKAKGTSLVEQRPLQPPKIV